MPRERQQNRSWTMSGFFWKKFRKCESALSGRQFRFSVDADGRAMLGHGEPH